MLAVNSRFSMGARLIVDRTHVVHETIDGEAILINLRTGTYYSLEGAGAELWTVLSGGADTDAVVAAALERYEGEPGEIERDVSRLVTDLVREGLLVEDPSPASESPALPAGRVPYSTPVLDTYTDMQEFMLVDPLHEVDETAGWPHAKFG